jgi:hypothetical protein
MGNNFKIDARKIRKIPMALYRSFDEVTNLIPTAQIPRTAISVFPLSIPKSVTGESTEIP